MKNQRIFHEVKPISIIGLFFLPAEQIGIESKIRTTFNKSIALSAHWFYGFILEL